MNRIIKIGVWIALVVVSLLADVSPCRAATPDSLVYSFYFRLGDAMLMADYRGNKQNFEALEQWMTPENIARISEVKVVGSASPEGSLALNNRLALMRAQAVRKYILWRWKINDKEAVVAIRQDNYLAAWILAVENDSKVPHKDKVLEILNSEASLQTKWTTIQRLPGGVSQYIKLSIFPQLRNSVACIVTLKEPLSETATTKIIDTAPSSENLIRGQDSTIRDSTSLVTTPTATPTATPTTTVVAEHPNGEATKTINEQTVVNEGNNLLPKEPGKLLRPLFAIKTNLLFDAATLVNIELEIPIGERWSVAGEWICPWWLWEKKQNCLQALSGNIEGKYWFGNRQVMSNGQPRPVMTGWHAGLYAGGGYYDLEHNKVGYQGEFFIAAGISGGYAHTINKNGSLRMEYSLGIGYMQTRYRKYDAEQDANGNWHLYRSSNGRYTWIGPTRARISLVWMISSKKKER